MIDPLVSITFSTTEEMPLWKVLLDSPFFSSLLALLGVYLGAHLNKKATSRQETHRMMIEYYADVLSLYTQLFAEDKTEQTIISICAAIDRARLISPPNILKILDEMRETLADPEPDSTHCSALADKLLETVQQELHRS